MRKFVSLALVLALMFGVLLVVGCGGNEGTVKIGDEEVKYSEKDGEVTIETDEGKITSSDTEVTEEDLGCPIYPGAEMGEGESGSVSFSDGEGEGSMISATFYTKDSVAEVVAWYKEKLAGEPNLMDMSSSAGGEEMGMFTFGAGDEGVNVMITADGTDSSKTMINITKGAGSGNMMTP